MGGLQTLAGSLAAPMPAGFGDLLWHPSVEAFELADAWALENSLDDLKRGITASAPRVPLHTAAPAGVETAHAGTGPPPCPNCGSWMQIKHSKDKTNWFGDVQASQVSASRTTPATCRRRSVRPCRHSMLRILPLQETCRYTC